MSWQKRTLISTKKRESFEIWPDAQKYTYSLKNWWRPIRTRMNHSIKQNYSLSIRQTDLQEIFEKNIHSPSTALIVADQQRKINME